MARGRELSRSKGVLCMGGTWLPSPNRGWAPRHEGTSGQTRQASLLLLLFICLFNVCFLSYVFLICCYNCWFCLFCCCFLLFCCLYSFHLLVLFVDEDSKRRSNSERFVYSLVKITRFYDYPTSKKVKNIYKKCEKEEVSCPTVPTIQYPLKEGLGN